MAGLGDLLSSAYKKLPDWMTGKDVRPIQGPVYVPPAGQAGSYRKNVAWDTAKALSDDPWTQRNIASGVTAGADFVPLVGEDVGVHETAEDIKAGNYLAAGLGGAGTIVGTVPIAGDVVATGLKGLAKKARGTADILAEATRPVVAAVEAAPGTGTAEVLANATQPGRREAITAVNLRHMKPEQALEIARSGRHIKPGTSPGEGTYVGAPYSMRTLEDLDKIRADFDQLVSIGAGGADWYERVHPWIKEMVGDDPVAQRELAQNLALFSSQANPDTNLGFAIKARNRNIMGMAEDEDIIHTGLQAQKYRNAFETGEPIFEQTQDTALKTNIYGQHLDPTAENPNVGTNDIWHARSFGYTTPEGDVWDAALSPQQHTWLDAETILATDRANRLGLGGKTDWTPGQIQAAAWVAAKGRSLAEKGFNKELLNKEAYQAAVAAAEPGAKVEKKAFKEGVQGPITQPQLAAGISEAAKTYPDYDPKYTFQGTGETATGKLTGHAPEIAFGNQAVRDEYTGLPGGGWRDPEGRDIIYGTQGAYTGRSGDMVGRFGGETNIGEVARPRISFDFDPKTGARILDPASEQLVRGSEAVRGYFDVQDAAAGSMAIPGEKVMNQRGYSIGGVPFSAESMDYLSSVLPGLSDVVHYGGDQGLLTNFMDRPEAAFGAKANKAIAANIQARYPEATVTPVGVQSTYTDYNAPLDADWMPEEHRAAWRGGAAPGEPIKQGTDRATNLMLSNLNDEQMRRLDNDQMKAAVRQKWQRDEDLAAQGKITVRPDVQTARKLFSEGGFDALKAAIGKGILPAAAAGIFLNEFMAPGEQAAPQRDQT